MLEILPSTRALRFVLCAFAMGLTLLACANPRTGLRSVMGQDLATAESEQKIRLMLSYDENSDGVVTRDELEAGLHRQFATADANHYGFLDIKETQAENDRRYKVLGTSYSPLTDWHQNGKIDFDEFAATARSIFEELDKNHDGKLDRNELRFPQSGRVVAAPAGAQRTRRTQVD
jgi:Ca2+-binding EF-hand superfamily protein